MRNLSLVFTCAAMFCFPDTSPAELKLPAIFSDSMILQRDQPVRIWGWAKAGSEITVQLPDQKHDVITDEMGRWEATLKPMKAGEPFEVKVSGDGKDITLKDVLAGEVWLCSGQSNMAMTVKGVKDAEHEIAVADLPTLRMFTVKSSHALEPQTDCEGTWVNSHPNTVGEFSATAFFFGKRLQQELQCPVGLINSSVGGTSIESWTSLSAQEQVDAIRPRLEAWQELDRGYDPTTAKERYEQLLQAWEKQKADAEAAGRKPGRRPQLDVQPHKDRNYPANLFNGKIHPLVGYTIRGVIWYQGENSAGRGFAHLYETQLETLIADWRNRWNQGDFPFAWVQLPNYRAEQTRPSETSGWVQVQEGMLRTLKVPNTGMAITIDVGEAGDIHPRNKQVVGWRLAQWALASVYDTDIIPMGPVYESCRQEGHKMVISFDHVGKKLVGKKEMLEGFAIAGEDRKFVWASAVIEGDQVVVWHDDIPDPQSVRYAWASNPKFSLYNSANIPASPFRTDDWEEAIPE